MGQIANDDAAKVERKDAPPARPETPPEAGPSHVWEDVQLEVPLDMVDANGVSVQSTAKITVTKPVFLMLCTLLVNALDMLGVQVREPTAPEADPEAVPEGEPR